MSTEIANCWVTRSRPDPQARIRLFCFPYAGGAASLFKSWANDMPAKIEVCPLQLPGRENRIQETPFVRVPALISAVATVLRSALERQPGPFALFGHSMGALIAFELARYLCAQGQPPAYLFVSGMRAPQRYMTGYPVHTLPDDMFIQILREMHGTPEEILQNTELMQILLPTLHADFELCYSYVYHPGPALPCAITAFGGTQDVAVSEEDLQAWSEQTSQHFRSSLLPGDHFFLQHAYHPLVREIAQDLSCILQTVE
jgi:medium-chain acyl-[acyl-carrier-protein] hydrolase